MSDQPVEHSGFVHGKLLDDTRLCPLGSTELATVFWKVVDCPSCVARLEEIKAEREAAAEQDIALVQSLDVELHQWQIDALRSLRVGGPEAHSPEALAMSARRTSKLAFQREWIRTRLALGEHVHVVTSNPRGLEIGDTNPPVRRLHLIASAGPAQPIPMRGLVARLEAAALRRGWTRLAARLAAFDERNLGK